MKSKLFINKNIIIQGITGQHGSFHTKKMIEYGTNIIAGTSRSNVGQKIFNVPIYKSIKDIKIKFPEINTTIIFVPALHAKNAIIEAINEQIPLIICITEGIPLHDMVEINSKLIKSKSILIGPNCPGIIIPGQIKLGIIPGDICLPGNVAIVSRSGTLTYEVINSLTRNNIGQKYIIGIGGDPIKGISFLDCIKFFNKDTEVKKIIFIGEIGGVDELSTINYIKRHLKKPIYGYIAGHFAPRNVQMGHAGAILGKDNESAQYKTKLLSKSGVIMSNSLFELIDLIK